jgi:hypothetical protein
VLLILAVHGPLLESSDPPVWLHIWRTLKRYQVLVLVPKILLSLVSSETEEMIFLFLLFLKMISRTSTSEAGRLKSACYLENLYFSFQYTPPHARTSYQPDKLVKL